MIVNKLKYIEINEIISRIDKGDLYFFFIFPRGGPTELRNRSTSKKKKKKSIGRAIGGPFAA